MKKVRSAWPKDKYSAVPLDMQHTSPDPGFEARKEEAFLTFRVQVEAVTSYTGLLTLLQTPLPIDQMIRIEDVAAQSLLRIMRGLCTDDFVDLVRRIKTDAPYWTRHINFTAFVGEELEMRYLLARMEKMLNEVNA